MNERSRSLSESLEWAADTINNIGEVYREQGKYAEAISWNERALRTKEREFGGDHVNLATTLHDIGLVYKAVAKSVSAKSYFERAAKLFKESRGVELFVLNTS